MLWELNKPTLNRCFMRMYTKMKTDKQLTQQIKILPNTFCSSPNEYPTICFLRIILVKFRYPIGLSIVHVDFNWLNRRCQGTTLSHYLLEEKLFSEDLRNKLLRSLQFCIFVQIKMLTVTVMPTTIREN